MYNTYIWIRGYDMNSLESHSKRSLPCFSMIKMWGTLRVKEESQSLLV